MKSKDRRGRQLAHAAAQFIGSPFRLYGRDPKQGLDCVGLVACSLKVVGCAPKVPSGYTLRNSDLGPWLHCAAQTGLIPASGSIESGDIILTNPGPGQYHLVIAECESQVIHAHAGIRRIVRQDMRLIEASPRRWRLP